MTVHLQAASLQVTKSGHAKRLHRAADMDCGVDKLKRQCDRQLSKGIHALHTTVWRRSEQQLAGMASCLLKHRL